MKSKIIKIRYPNLNGKQITTAAKANEERLINTLEKLLISEKQTPPPQPVRKPIEGGRYSTKPKKPKTFAL